jgi:uncharacterized membrane protein
MSRTFLDSLEPRQLLAATYTLTLLQPVAGATTAHALAINAAGTVVGYSSVGTSRSIPTLWKNGVATALPNSPLNETAARGIDDAGDILYGSYKRTAAGKFVYLQTPLGAAVEGTAINNHGDVVASATGLSNGIVIVKGDGTFVHVGTPAGYDSAVPYDINDRGDVVGYATNSKGSILFLYSAASRSFSNLPIPAGSPPINGVFAVNNLGVAAGFITRAIDQITISHHAATWTNGVIKDLGVLNPPYDFSIAYAVNDAGVVVGDVGDGSFVYSGGTMRELNALTSVPAGVKLERASGINAAGRIIGYAQTAAGERGFLLTPIATGSGSIRGTVFNDVDADGVLDAGEARLGGRTVFLDANHNGIKDAGERSTVSDASGNYALVGLTGGSYRVRRVTPAGYRYTVPSTGFYDLTLAAGQSVTGKNFGVSTSVLISGAVFNDANSDRIRNATEKGLSSWRVFIDKDKDGLFDAGEASVLSDINGNWSFRTLAAGTYVVRVVQQSGWTRTTPTAGSFALTLAAGGSSTGKLFGEKKA